MKAVFRRLAGLVICLGLFCGALPFQVSASASSAVTPARQAVDYLEALPENSTLTRSMLAEALAMAAGQTDRLCAGWAGKLTNRASLRAAPRWHSDVLSELPAGATVEILSCSGAWFSVSFQGQTGYLSRYALSLYYGTCPDIEPGKNNGDAAAWAVENGIILPVGGLFRGDAALTREELCAVLARFLTYQELVLPA